MEAKWGITTMVFADLALNEEKLTCLLLMKHFSNAGFPCPIMQSPSDHFLRAINTDFDRIIAMCKNWQVIAYDQVLFIIMSHTTDCIIKVSVRITPRS